MCFLITQISTNRILVRFDPFSQSSLDFFRFFKIAKQKWRTRSMPHRIVLRLVLLLFPFRFFVLIFLVDIAGYCWAFLAKKKDVRPRRQTIYLKRKSMIVDLQPSRTPIVQGEAKTNAFWILHPSASPSPIFLLKRSALYLGRREARVVLRFIRTAKQGP